jgi:hypothetical protein
VLHLRVEVRLTLKRSHVPKQVDLHARSLLT